MIAVYSQRFWIGLTLDGDVGTWVNGESLTTDTGWDTNQPDGTGERCTEARGSNNQWGWTDEGCHNTKRYICEYPL